LEIDCSSAGLGQGIAATLLAVPRPASVCCASPAAAALQSPLDDAVCRSGTHNRVLGGAHLMRGEGQPDHRRPVRLARSARSGHIMFRNRRFKAQEQ
jgi:hypothetical protein